MAARHCTFESCEVAHTGGYGIWLEHGCKDNRIVQCHVHDLGAIHDGGHVYHAGVGVWIGRSSHNRVHFTRET